MTEALISSRILWEHRWWGDPVAKGRPKVTRRGFAYTPKKTREAEAVLVENFLGDMAKPKKPIDAPLAAVVVFHMPIPKSFSKKAREAAVWHCKRPDIDNLEKLLYDAMEKAGVISNDSLICQAIISKKYSSAPGIYVKLLEARE